MALNKLHKGLISRYGKFLLCNIPGTIVDLFVVQLFAVYIFRRSSYAMEYVISPLISYECAILTDYVLCYFFVWGNQVGQRSLKSFFRHMLGYNLSSLGAFFVKEIVILLSAHISGLTVFWCDLIAMTFSGTFNFAINERFIFRKKGAIPLDPEPLDPFESTEIIKKQS